MNIKVITGPNEESFEERMEFWMEKLVNDGCKIIDVQFGGCCKQQFSYGVSYVYSAMIIYE